MHQNGGSSPAGEGDPELARICELRDAMALSPRELIAKLTSQDAIGVADHVADGEPGGNLTPSFAAIPALASLASIVTSLQGDPLPQLRAEPEVGLPGNAPPASPLLPAGEASGTPRGDEPRPSQSASAGSISDGRSGFVRRRVYAAGLGLIIGLALVAGGLLWLAGWIDPSLRSQVRETGPMDEKAANLGEVAKWSAVAKPELAARKDLMSPGPSETSETSETSEASEASGVLDRPATATTPRSSLEPLVQEARRRIERGDVAGARDLLANADTDASGLVLFALAETYDPNVLAAWGMRGISPNIEKAKGFYAAALSLGYAAARQRLDSLQ
jgi:hypothetical protein